MTFYVLVVAGSICLVYAAIELGRLVSRFVDDKTDQEPTLATPLVSYGACCLPQGCRDYSDVDLDIAKADCEAQGGTFKAFSKCSDGVCPENKVEKPAKKTRQKSPPNSSMKVSRKGSKKAQRKKRDR